MILTISVAVWLLTVQLFDRFRDAATKLRHNRQALTTTEWALLAAGASAIAVAVVAVVRTQTNTASGKIRTDVNSNKTF